MKALCDRKIGVGADGVMVVTLRPDGALDVDFRNPDGSRSFCGNGTRSAYAWALEQDLLSSAAILHAINELTQVG